MKHLPNTPTTLRDTAVAHPLPTPFFRRAASALRSSCSRASLGLSCFRRSEDGMVTILACFLVIMMVMIGGIGVDLMRNEMARTTIQSTLDRAILAAADLEQTQDPEAVVRDYFAKADMTQYLESVTVTPGPELPTTYYRKVSAEARAITQSPFMGLSGVDTLPVLAAGRAEEVITNVEVSLVLDVSGSMNSNNRLPTLKVAAKKFIDQMIDNSRDGRLSISIIPYATQVSAPAHFLNHFHVSNEHNYSNCVNFEQDDFDDTEIEPFDDHLDRTMHFSRSTWSRFDGRMASPDQLIPNSQAVCTTYSHREMLIMQDDRVALKNFIDNLYAEGYTSIDVGVKWGVGLLDPDLRPVINAMINEGTIEPQFATRPFDYEDDETLKVVVLMTDGENTTRWYMDDSVRRGNSDIWWNESKQQYSVWDPTSNQFYYPDQYSPYGGRVTADVPYGCDLEPLGTWNCTNTASEGGAVNLSFGELWAKTTVRSNAERNYAPWMGYYQARSAWQYGLIHSINSTTMDRNTHEICDEAKDERIVVYTIGFEAPPGGVAVLKDCASSPSHFFDVEGLEIANAFESIANQITQLRLTQ